MENFADLIQQGNGWLFIPGAVVLGILHGLEPGHSKTMMAAFIVAIRGTVAQAVLLGLSATVSHTAVVWIVVLLGMHYGQRWNTETSEPYFQLVSAALIIGIASLMMARAWREHLKEKAAHTHHHHDHDHHHHNHDKEDAIVETFGYQDAHERAHAHDLQRRFDDRKVTTGQIILFGLSGGLIPCPAAITVLLLCLQLKQFTLGVTLVLCFSIGLAVTMIASGVIAAVSVRHFSKRWSGFGVFARRAPYLASAVIICIGLYIGYHGWVGLNHL